MDLRHPAVVECSRPCGSLGGGTSSSGIGSATTNASAVTPTPDSPEVQAAGFPWAIIIAIVVMLAGGFAAYKLRKKYVIGTGTQCYGSPTFSPPSRTDPANCEYSISSACTGSFFQNCTTRPQTATVEAVGTSCPGNLPFNYGFRGVPIAGLRCDATRSSPSGSACSCK